MHRCDTMSPVPNSPKTPVRGVRICDDLWDRFGEHCDAKGTDRTKRIVRLIEKDLGDRTRL